MKTLNFICPWCMGHRSYKVDITCYYRDDFSPIPWECPVCKFKGVWERVPRKANVFVRTVKAIKKAWHQAKELILLAKGSNQK